MGARFFFVLLLVLAARSGPAQAEAKLSLQECIATAVKQQPAIRAAEQSVIAGRGRVTQAGYSSFPQASARTGYSEDHSTGGVFDGATKSYASTFQVDQTLYDFGKTGNAVDAARWSVRSLKQEMEGVVQDVILGVKQAYYALLAANNLVAVAEKRLEQTESRLRQAVAFFRAGSKPRFEVTRAEVDVNTARLNLINARNGVRIRTIALNKAMGLEPGRRTEISDQLPPLPEPPALDQAETLALSSRPEMLKAAANIEAARARERAERANYLPKITANGAYTWATGTSEAGAFGSFDVGDSWNAGIFLAVPLFQGGLTAGRVAEARANALATKFQQDGIRQSVLLEVNESYADMESAKVRIEVMESSLQKARESLELAQGRYAAGVGPYLEVTDAQLAAVQAETDFIQAQYDYRLSVARLFRAIGMAEYGNGTEIRKN